MRSCSSFQRNSRMCRAQPGKPLLTSQLINRLLKTNIHSTTPCALTKVQINFVKYLSLSVVRQKLSNPFEVSFLNAPPLCCVTVILPSWLTAESTGSSSLITQADIQAKCTSLRVISRAQRDAHGCQAPSASQGHLGVCGVRGVLHRRSQITPPSALPPSALLYVSTFSHSAPILPL